MARPLMIQGTASNVGKTIIAMALCRIFKQDGYKVAPFKSQNITPNTARLENGDEIAVSQLLQAYAAGVEPEVCMNPVILKPQGPQVILNGRPHEMATDGDFTALKQKLIPEIMKAYATLDERYDIIVIEGAGSPVELNLTRGSDDIVNMGIAKRVNAPVLLVSDIDRGGIFASLYGTLNLLDEDERQCVKAMIVNRFRGDIESFADGVKILEDITGVPVAGVVPYIEFDIPEEDTHSSNYTPENNYDRQLDLIADNIRTSLDMELIYKTIL